MPGRTTTPMPRKSTTTKPRSPRRKVAVALSIAAIAFNPAGIGSAGAEIAPPPAETSEALRAAGELAAGTPGTDYFAPETIVALGYEPGVADGVAMRPDGDCSSPVELPASFDNACRTHDLGYDLLRIAHDHDVPIPEGLRRALDSQLGARMHASCGGTDVAGCHMIAAAAEAAVAANTIRQAGGTPVHEELPDILASFTGASPAESE